MGFLEKLLGGRGTPHERIHKAIFRIRGNKSLMGVGVVADLVEDFVPVPDGQAGQMSTNGRGIFYDPKFVNSASDAELRYMVMHNLTHIALAHHIRIAGKNLEVANIAADVVVNRMLTRSRPAIDEFIVPPDDTLVMEEYADPSWAFESIYFDLMRKLKKEHPKAGDQEDENGSGQGGDGEQQQQQNKGQGGGQGQDGDQEPQQGGDGGGGEGQAPPRPQQLQGQQRWGEIWPSPPREHRKEIGKIRQKLAEGRLAEKAIGDTPGSITGYVDEEDGDLAAWDFLRAMLEEIYSHERTWAHPNVNYLDHGYLPSRKKSVGTLHVAIDTSGSVSLAELKCYLRNIRFICSSIGIPKIKIAYIDATIHRYDDGGWWHEIDVDGGDDVELHVSGRGGTSFDPVFKCIEEEGEEVTALVYFTDGEGHCSVDPPDYHTIWCTSNRRPYGKGNTNLEWGHHLVVRAHI